MSKIVLLRRVVGLDVGSTKGSFSVPVENDAGVDQDANEGQAG